MLVSLQIPQTNQTANKKKTKLTQKRIIVILAGIGNWLILLKLIRAKIDSFCVYSHDNTFAAS